jgi:hypothetical protein
MNEQEQPTVYRTSEDTTAWCDGCDSEKPAVVEAAEKLFLCLDCILPLARVLGGAVYAGQPADIARRADADAHPWGEPGVVPAPTTHVWVMWGGRAIPASIHGDLRHFRLLGDDRDTRIPCTGYRFRVRWAPDAPEAPQPAGTARDIAESNVIG